MPSVHLAEPVALVALAVELLCYELPAEIDVIALVARQHLAMMDRQPAGEKRTPGPGGERAN